MSERILVASDGRAGALGAVRVAARIAAEAGASVEVVAVYEPVDLYSAGSPEAVSTFPEYFIPAAREAVRARLMEQLASVGGGAEQWPVLVETGRVAGTIARVARERRAGLVLGGLRKAGGPERWLSRETLLRLVHLSTAPVLAVPEDAVERPREAVVAVDFSPFSVRAAREAADRLPSGARLHLVHVTWPMSGLEGWSESAGWVTTYRRGVQQRLGELADALRNGSRRETSVAIVEGDPAKELLRYSSDVGADLIATGSHGSGFFGRLILGSVSKSLVHRADCAVLVAPPAPGAGGIEPDETALGRVTPEMDLLPEAPA